MSHNFRTVDISSKDKRQMYRYLEYANGNHMSLPFWTNEKWTSAHGETRSSSQHTFHLGFRISNGHYYTCILVDTTRSKGAEAIEGTVRDWGTEQPSLTDVLEYYQGHYNVQPRFPIERSNNRKDDDNGGGGGAGTSGGSGSGWTKRVYKTNYGGYGYTDKDGEYRECDQYGNDIIQESSRYSSRSSHRHGSSNKTYGDSYGSISSGSRTHASTSYQPRSSSSVYYSAPSQVSTRSYPRYTSESYDSPSYSSSRSHADRHSQPSYSSSRSYADHHSQPSYGSSSYYSSTKSSSSRHHTDPASGKEYYIGRDGKAYWA